MTKLLGVVLCGGQSTRMGRDKGLIPIQDTVWARYVATKFEALQVPVVVSVNPAQLDEYSRLFPSEHLVVDKVPAVEGPLQGLLSVHQQYPDYDLLLIACDMIDLEEATLAFLLAAYESEEPFDFYAFMSGDFYEPFCAIYKAAGLKAVKEKVASGALDNFSLMNVLRSGNTRGLPLLDSNSFRNYNTL